jgi:hypothetical protein
MKRFLATTFLSLSLGLSLTAASALFFSRGVDYERRGAPFWWIETQGYGFFGLDRYMINRQHLVADVMVWAGISWVLLSAYLSVKRSN